MQAHRYNIRCRFLLFNKSIIKCKQIIYYTTPAKWQFNPLSCSAKSTPSEDLEMSTSTQSTRASRAIRNASIELGNALVESPPCAHTMVGLVIHPHFLSRMRWKRRRQRWKKAGGTRENSASRSSSRRRRLAGRRR